MNSNFFDDFFKDENKKETVVKEEKKVEPKVEKKVEPKNEVAKKEETAVTNKPKNANEFFLSKVIEYGTTSGDEIDNKTKKFAFDIITSMNKSVLSNNYEWGKIDVQGCNLISQIKRWAKLGVSMNDYLYIDFRNNGKTGLVDAFIKGQYQTFERLMVLYFKHPIVRFKTEIICEGDTVVKEEDFETGITKIVKHERNLEADRNSLDNITGAYKIAYVDEKRDGKLTQLFVEIDKNRITRAMNASSSKDKGVWKADTVKMVKKTVTHEMFNSDTIRPFMNYPEDIIKDLSILNESEEMNWNQERKYQDVKAVNNDIEYNAGTGEVLSNNF